MKAARVTERTLYPSLIDVIEKKGGSGVSEVSYGSVPDIIFNLNQRNWLLSVKIGENPRTIKDAFLQYLRQKEESQASFGILLFLPEDIRKTRASSQDLDLAINTLEATAMIDATIVKEELRNLTFPQIVDFVQREVVQRIATQQESNFPFNRIISLLKVHVQDMMNNLNLGETELLQIITNRSLLTDLASLQPRNSEAVARFLAAYIFLSQILFLRLLFTARPEIVTIYKPVCHAHLRAAFEKILEINYRPIFKLDVLDAIDDVYLRDTFNLLWGLEVEKVRYELPGRIFHDLMPLEIRKMLAAFYTRPNAAELLADLTILKATETVFDPACGSGTILTAAYRRKLNLYRKQGHVGEPHRRFCESEILGADIMPFAVHLTSANLAAMNPKEIIHKTQVIQGNSLGLEPSSYPSGTFAGSLFPDAGKAETMTGESYQVDLKPVDAILMNPPFTKIERGIRNLVNMESFAPKCGGEIGLWGHFIALSDSFLKRDGRCGMVLPVNILRGRESTKIRKLLFNDWTPLYVLKPSQNYGFSECAEYRDVIIVAKKQKPAPDSKVKFCIIKSDLSRLNEFHVQELASLIEQQRTLRGSQLVDIDTHTIEEIKDRFSNMMWFCGVSDLYHRDILVSFINKFRDILSNPPASYFREGYRPAPKGVSQFMFATRASKPSRVEQAFLKFNTNDSTYITCTSPIEASFQLETKSFRPSLRTPVSLDKFDLEAAYDFVACSPYSEIGRVCQAAGINSVPAYKFWQKAEKELQRVQTNIVISRKINPYSPSTHLTAFYSDTPFCPSNQLNVILESDRSRAKALCTILNSAIFYSQFFLLKEESTGRYIDIRFYDLAEMLLIPNSDSVSKLEQVYEKYKGIKFESLQEQFDKNFQVKYQEYWENQKNPGITRLHSKLGLAVEASFTRLSFDTEICNALGVKVTKQDLLRVYEVIVKEMIITRGLSRN